MRHGEIDAFQPYLVIDLIGFETLSPSINHQFLCLLDGCLCFPLQFIDVGALFRQFWYFMGSECLVGSWCEPHDKFEWGFLCCVTGPRIVSVLCNWKPVVPICLHPI